MWLLIKQTQKQSQAGFTILETLIAAVVSAILILGIGIFARGVANNVVEINKLGDLENLRQVIRTRLDCPATIARYQANVAAYQQALAAAQQNNEPPPDAPPISMVDKNDETLFDEDLDGLMKVGEWEFRVTRINMQTGEISVSATHQQSREQVPKLFSKGPGFFCSV